VKRTPNSYHLPDALTLLLFLQYKSNAECQQLLEKLHPPTHFAPVTKRPELICCAGASYAGAYQRNLQSEIEEASELVFIESTKIVLPNTLSKIILELFDLRTLIL